VNDPWCDLADLTDIAWSHHETGKYRGTHLKVTLALFDQMKAASPNPPPPQQVINTIMGIPIVIDPDMPEGTWRLVDNRSKATVREGVIPPPESAAIQPEPAQ
jgi:hypothetical protein